MLGTSRIGLIIREALAMRRTVDVGDVIAAPAAPAPARPIDRRRRVSSAWSIHIAGLEQRAARFRTNRANAARESSGTIDPMSCAAPSDNPGHRRAPIIAEQRNANAFGVPSNVVAARPWADGASRTSAAHSIFIAVDLRHQPPSSVRSAPAGRQMRRLGTMHRHNSFTPSAPNG